MRRGDEGGEKDDGEKDDGEKYNGEMMMVSLPVLLKSGRHIPY